MKKFMTFLFCAASLSLLISCQKSDPVGDELTGIDLKSAGNSVVIMVPRTGSDDTENLLKAFADAAVAGPGTTIQLEAGDYFTRYVEVFNFCGTLKGAGRDKTTVQAIPGLDVEEMFLENVYPAWWRMTGGKITLSDLTFRTPDGNMVKEGYSETLLGFGKDLFSIFVFNNYNDLYYHPENSQKVNVERVNFIGGFDNPADGIAFPTDHNVMLGIWMGYDFWWPLPGVDYPLTRGEFKITDCYFEHFINALEGSGFGEHATMGITGSIFDKCYWPLYFTANYNSKISILNNSFSGTDGWYEITIEDNDWGLFSPTEVLPLSKCLYLISGNIFNTKLPIPAIATNDHWVYMGPEERLPMQIIIQNNLFKMVEGGSGIQLNNSQDAVVRNNRFLGSCTTGIAVDGFNPIDPEAVPYARNALILGNNFSNLTSFVANVYLGEKTMDCTVVGANTRGVIVDNGVNNKVTGMGKGPGLKLGPTIVDNLRMVRGPRK